MKLWRYVEAMNKVGQFLGDYEATDQRIKDFALEKGLSGMGYFRPDNAYVNWRISDGCRDQPRSDLTPLQERS